MMQWHSVKTSILVDFTTSHATFISASRQVTKSLNIIVNNKVIFSLDVITPVDITNHTTSTSASNQANIYHDVPDSDEVIFISEARISNDITTIHTTSTSASYQATRFHNVLVNDAGKSSWEASIPINQKINNTIFTSVAKRNNVAKYQFKISLNKELRMFVGCSISLEEVKYSILANDRYAYKLTGIMQALCSGEYKSPFTRNIVHSDTLRIDVTIWTLTSSLK